MGYQENIVRLVRLYLLGEVTDSEKEQLEKWCNESDRNRLFFEQILQEQALAKEFKTYDEINERHAFRKFERQVKGRFIFHSWGWKIASVIVLVAGMTLMGYLVHLKEQTSSSVLTQGPILPGSYKAILVLSTGEQITLQDQTENQIIVEKDIFVTDSNHQLVYSSFPKEKTAELTYNKLEVPRGGEYKLILSDGTTVYLNSATTLKYPVQFGEGERKVCLSGEAFFEVAKDSLHPFIVETAKAEIKVLGTSFNVNTFRNEGIQTVLIEGKVQVRLPRTNEIVAIEPGQMALADENTGIEVRKVDVRLYTDWKRGIFRFENQRLEDIMNTLSNWYDVDVFYQSQNVKELHFSGFMERYEQIGVILDAINEATGVVFAIKGRTITISE